MPRFQFTIRGLLWATFWVAVCGAAWTLDLRGFDKWYPVQQAAIIVALLLTPFMAIGALFGGPLVGLLVGVVAFVAFNLLIMFLRLVLG